MPSTISGASVVADKVVTDEIENSAGANPYNITLNSEIDTSSGSQSYDVTGIPTGVKRITVLLAGVSTSGTEKLMIQLGTGSSPTTSGYLGGADYDNAGGGINLGAGFQTNDWAAGHIAHGAIKLWLQDATNNVWVCDARFKMSSGVENTRNWCGSVPLSGVLDMIRIKNTGTDTFDAGGIGVQFE
jgi:hypothetical protein